MKDQLGILCSGLCIIHCLVVPVILMLGITGVLSTVFTDELFHQILLVPVILFFLLSLHGQDKCRKRTKLLVTGFLGIALLIVALVLDEKYETLLTMVGGSLLIFYHISNLRFRSYNHNN